MRQLLVCVLLLCAGTVFSQARLAGDFGFSAQVDGGLPSTKEEIDLSVRSAIFDAVLTSSINSDGKYGADIANLRDSHTFLHSYVLIESGYTTLHLNPVEFQVGRLRPQDPFDSPYSLFLNANHPTSMGAVLPTTTRSSATKAGG